MVVKVYISGISGNKEVKKRQQRVILILDSKNVKYEVIDIAEPDNEESKDFMQNNSTSSGCTISDPNPRHPLPPQIFNDDTYCGDYDQFDMANEIDEMEKFLKLAPDDSAPIQTSNAEIKLDNGTGDDKITSETTKDDEETKDVETLENTSESKEDEEKIEENGAEISKNEQEDDDEEEEADDDE